MFYDIGTPNIITGPDAWKDAQVRFYCDNGNSKLDSIFALHPTSLTYHEEIEGNYNEIPEKTFKFTHLPTQKGRMVATGEPNKWFDTIK